MTIKKYLLAGLSVGILSLLYNFIVFSVLGIYPDLDFEVNIFGFGAFDFYFVIFLKNFFVGLILTVLFSQGYNCIGRSDLNSNDHQAKGIFFFTLYAIFALLSFSIGDIFLMDTTEGMLVLLTIDGFIEGVIATIPIRLFHN